MDKEFTTRDAALVIDSIRPAPSGTYVLYCWHDMLGIAKPKNVPMNCIRISRITAGDINNGLCLSEWYRIQMKLLELNKETKPCQEPQKLLPSPSATSS